MRYDTDIQVEQAIIHKVFRDDFLLSERPLPFDGHENLARYLAAHIESSLHDPSAKAARFISVDVSLPSGLCQGLLASTTPLVEGSCELAKQLHEIIAHDDRISDGALVVCFYLATNQLERRRYLALLKLDSTEAYRPVTTHDATGKVYVGLESAGNLMPTTGQKLHKCAFVRPLVPRLEYDMMLLDRQVALGAPMPVARFFVESFLGAQMALDNRQRTERLYQTLVSAHNQLRSSLSPPQNEALYLAIHNAITSLCVNVDNLVDALPIPVTARQKIREVVALRVPDTEFEIDAEYARKLVLKRKFKGDNGLVLEVTAEGYDQIVESPVWVEEPGGRPYYRIVIHTENWKEVPNERRR